VNDVDSILTSVKKMLGITEEYDVFDRDLVMHINSVFMILTQLGVGPANGFTIINKDNVWTDFISEDNKNFEAVKSYMFLKVRLIFDPPTGSIMKDCMRQMINELEWRLNLAAEST
jgi:hypothetical protein